VKWYAGSDHAGFDLKDKLVQWLRGKGDEVVDLGTQNADVSVDYPDYGEKVGRAVAAEPGAFGLLVCGTGIGQSMAANKIPGIRAALVSETYSARMARAHNDANVVCLGERVVGGGVAEEILSTFRATAFAAGRHLRRVEKLEALDKARGSR